MPESNILYALLLTLFAGLSTGIGSAIALVARHTNKKFLSFSLGLSAGVMIYISFVEILAASRADLAGIMGAKTGNLVATLSFFGGILIAAVIDRLVPSGENPHEMRRLEELGGHKRRPARDLGRMGVFTALAVAVHNFPEGIATFMAAAGSPSIGIPIAIAVAIHNIPEGIAVSVPIYFATKSRRKAFWLSFLSGLAEPVGAVAAYLVLLPFMSPVLLGCVFAAVAGIMVFISLDELLPAAQEYGEHHVAITGLIAGMAVMAVSLVLLA